MSNLFHCDPLPIYHLTSSLFALGYLILGACFIHRLTGIKTAWAGLLLFQFPEISSIASYPNTSTFGGVLALGSIYFLLDKPRYSKIAIAGFLMGLAAFIRCDALMMIATTPFLIFLSTDKKINPTLSYFLLYACVAFIVWQIFLIFSGGSLRELYGAVSTHLNHFSTFYLSLTVILLSFSFFSIILILLGIIYLFKKREVTLVLLLLSGLLAFFFFYRFAITTPKYLYYGLPFAGALTVFGFFLIKEIFQSKKRMRALFLNIILLFLFLDQYALYQNPGDKGKTLAGSYMFTHDAFRPLYGFLYAPIDWHRGKKSTALTELSLRAVIHKNAEDFHLLTYGWLASRIALYELTLENFVLVNQQISHRKKWDLCLIHLHKGPVQAWVLTLMDSTTEDLAPFWNHYFAGHQFWILSEYPDHQFYKKSIDSLAPLLSSLQEAPQQGFLGLGQAVAR